MCLWLKQEDTISDSNSLFRNKKNLMNAMETKKTYCSKTLRKTLTTRKTTMTMTSMRMTMSSTASSVAWMTLMRLPTLKNKNRWSTTCVSIPI